MNEKLLRATAILRPLLLYGAQAMLLIALLVLRCGLYERDLRIPFGFSIGGDQNHHLMIAKTLTEGGWWWHIPRQSAPFGLDMVLFPVGGTVDIFIMKILSFGISEPGTLLNVFWILAFVLAGSVAMWSLRSLGLPTWLAFACGCMYACLPHIFYRGIDHLMLVHYLLPIPIAAAIRVAAGTYHTTSRTQRVVDWVFCVLLGLNYVYFAFFVCFILLVAAVRAKLSRDNRSVWAALRLMGVIGLMTAVNLAPSVYAWSQDPIAADNVKWSKGAANESDVYALKIRHLLMPNPHHPLKLWRSAQTKVVACQFPLENENATTQLGTFGSLGLLLLIIALLRRSPASPASAGSAELRAAAVLTVACLLLATTGGLGSLFNVFVSPAIRCYNRISPIIAFFSFFALAVNLAYLAGRWRFLSKAWVSWTAASLLVVIAFFDQAPELSAIVSRDAYRQDVVRYTELTEFIAQVEDLVGDDAMIYQLPDTPYPMMNHGHARVYAFSQRLRLSWPALAGDAVRFHKAANSSNVDDLVRNLALAGYDGVWIDCPTSPQEKGNLETLAQAAKVWGLHDVLTIASEQEFSEDLAAAANAPLRRSRHGHYAFVAIGGVQDKLRNTYTTAELQRMRAQLLAGELVTEFLPIYRLGEIVDFRQGGNSTWYARDGWSVEEPWGRWSDGEKAVMQMQVRDWDEGPATLRIRASAYVCHQRPLQAVDVEVNGTNLGRLRFHYEENGGTIRELQVKVPAGVIGEKGNVELALLLVDTVSPQALGMAEDERRLGISMESLRLEQRHIERFDERPAE